MYMKKILFVIVFCFSALFFQQFALAEAQYSFNQEIFSEESEEKEVLPEGVPEPAVLITNDEGIPEEPAWTYRYLIPTSVAIATIIILGNVIQYFRKVVKKRYKIVEEKKN